MRKTTTSTNLPPKDPLAELLARVEAARAHADASARMLSELEQEVRRLMTGAPKVGAPAALNSEGTRDWETPMRPDTKLDKLSCPSCNGPLVWKWSGQRQSWFAGCTNFPRCRGARSSDEVRRVLATGSYAARPSVPKTDKDALEVFANGATTSEQLRHFDPLFDRVVEKHHGADGLRAVLTERAQTSHLSDDDDVPF